jgi:cell division protein FtsB
MYSMEQNGHCEECGNNLPSITNGIVKEAYEKLRLSYEKKEQECRDLKLRVLELEAKIFDMEENEEKAKMLEFENK